MKMIFFNGTHIEYTQAEFASVYSMLMELNKEKNDNTIMNQLLIKMEDTLNNTVNKTKNYSITYIVLEKTVELINGITAITLTSFEFSACVKYNSEFDIALKFDLRSTLFA